MAIVTLKKYGDLMTIEEWEECCNIGLFIDYDGHGNFCNPETNQLEDAFKVYPSERFGLSYKTQKVQWTHILWYNR